MRAKITKILDRDTVFVEIGQPMAKSHSFRRGDLVACRRTAGVLGETWQAIENRPTVHGLPAAEKPKAEVKPVVKPRAKPKPAKKPVPAKKAAAKIKAKAKQ
jgi:hypothetical protein